MKLKPLTLAALVAVASISGCAHRSDEASRKEAFQDNTDDRIDNMERNIRSLKQRSSQLLGEPKQELDAAIVKLEDQVAVARAELRELQSRGSAEWVQKKEQVDQHLYEMDNAYSKALSTLSAH